MSGCAACFYRHKDTHTHTRPGIQSVPERLPNYDQLQRSKRLQQVGSSGARSAAELHVSALPAARRSAENQAACWDPAPLHFFSKTATSVSDMKSVNLRPRGDSNPRMNKENMQKEI